MENDFFYIIENLKKIPRQGWIDKTQISNPESVSDHAFSVAIIAMIFSDMNKTSTIKVLKMALLHDLAESITGDITPKMMSVKNKNKLEENAMKKILKKLPESLAREYTQLWNEYKDNKTVESKLVHDVDKFEMALQAKVYEKLGINKNKFKPFYNTAFTKIHSAEIKQILRHL